MERKEWGKAHLGDHVNRKEARRGKGSEDKAWGGPGCWVDCGAYGMSWRLVYRRICPPGVGPAKGVVRSRVSEVNRLGREGRARHRERAIWEVGGEHRGAESPRSAEAGPGFAGRWERSLWEPFGGWTGKGRVVKC